jgi:(1->4)-alpha-D-glucan 1-alpha-D-glucosylmutase
MSTADVIYEATLERISQRRNIPRSTYRIQFHAGFTFKDATAIVPYLARLGISHVYASPYFKARPGSLHGYDIIDHGKLNPELGTTADFEELVETLSRHGMSHIVDMVPNHAGVGTNLNRWWNDVLENGLHSPYAKHFDIDWNSSRRPELRGKVLLPVLGERYGDALENGSLSLAIGDDGVCICYYDRRFPLALESYAEILENAGEADVRLDEIRNQIRGLSGRGDTDLVAERSVLKARLLKLLGADGNLRTSVAATLTQFAGKKGDARSWDALDRLLDRQHYRLAYWGLASTEINYRRFFDINDLAALRMEDQGVFDDAHACVLRLLIEGKITGLRIDHPDGLYDPRQYFDRLQAGYFVAVAETIFDERDGSSTESWPEMRLELLRRFKAREHNHSEKREEWPCYVVAEKILAFDEPLPELWAVDGTTGYDFLDMVNGLFIDGANEEAFTEMYKKRWAEADNFEDLVHARKRLILDTSLAGDLQSLANALDQLAQHDRRGRDFARSDLTEALREVVASFPVYRTYIASTEITPEDVKAIDAAIADATKRNSAIDPGIFRFIKDTLRLRGSEEDGKLRERQLRFAGKFQQLTAPVTAKGIEDTAFYIYNRLISLNEVGGNPALFGVTPATLHRYLADRQAKWPHALSPLSTHDTKRSEDVRARLNVISEIPAEWATAVERWSAINLKHRETVNGNMVPDANEEYLIYQTLVGAWPSGEQLTSQQLDAFAARIKSYMQKAIREAKVHSLWTNPVKAYEDAVDKYISGLLDPGNEEYLVDMSGFVKSIERAAIVKTVAQTLLRITAPGVPDTYQGTETIDLSLVDPDNRRPVDYTYRSNVLEGLDAAATRDRASLLRELMSDRSGHKAKLFVTAQSLRYRLSHSQPFAAGEYVPLNVRGQQAGRVFAFARMYQSAVVIVIVPRLTMSGPDMTWGDTAVEVPSTVQIASLRDVLSARRIELIHLHNGPGIQLRDALEEFPVALLVND